MFAFVLLPRAPPARNDDLDRERSRLARTNYLEAISRVSAQAPGCLARPLRQCHRWWWSRGGQAGAWGRMGVCVCWGVTQVQHRFEVAHLTGDLKAASATAWMTFERESARLSRVCVCVCVCLLLCASPYVFSCPWRTAGCCRLAICFPY